jgi:hypothetical protein
VAHCRKRLRQPARRKRAALLGGAAHWRCGPRKTERRERGTGATPVHATSLRSGACRRPTASSGRAGTGDRAHKARGKMATTRAQRAGVKRGRERRRGETSARWPEMVAWWDAQYGALPEAEVECGGAFRGEEEMAERDARAIARGRLAGGGTRLWSKRQRRRACERRRGARHSLCGRKRERVREPSAQGSRTATRRAAPVHGGHGAAMLCRGRHGARARGQARTRETGQAGLRERAEAEAAAR